MKGKRKYKKALETPGPLGLSTTGVTHIVRIMQINGAGAEWGAWPTRLPAAGPGPVRYGRWRGAG